VPGAGPGELTSPGQIAVDADGSVYVLEGGPLTPRVSAFDARGRFLRVFGRDVDAANPGTGFEVCTSKCKAATRGSRAGELDRPFGITIDPAGILWVSDGGNHRVAAYTVDGTFLRAFGKDVNLSLGGRRNVCSTRCRPGVSDGSAGAINGPLGVGVNAAGTMYVNDGERVTVLSPEGDFLRAFGKDVIPGNAETGFEVCTTLCRGGTEGTGPREFFGPRSTVFDAAGRIYISDSDNNRVQVLNRREGFRQAFGKDVVPGNAQTGFEVCTTQCQAGASGAGPGQTSFPQQLAIDCRGGLYVAEQNNDRVERFGEPGTDGEPCVAASVLTSGFGVMQVERHVRTGTATLIVTVPRAATVRVDGARILPARRRAAGARRLRLAIRPTARTARRLERTGRALVRANVSYTATNGTHHRKTRLILLTKNGRR
jgi:DNA-binding beta-propeller fold protein YncE